MTNGNVGNPQEFSATTPEALKYIKDSLGRADKTSEILQLTFNFGISGNKCSAYAEIKWDPQMMKLLTVCAGEENREAMETLRDTMKDIAKVGGDAIGTFINTVGSSEIFSMVDLVQMFGVVANEKDAMPDFGEFATAALDKMVETGELKDKATSVKMFRKMIKLIREVKGSVEPEDILKAVERLAGEVNKIKDMEGDGDPYGEFS